MKLKSLLKTLKLNESSLSMIFGAILIIAVGIIAINYFSGKSGETIPSVNIEETKLPTTHVVKEGEDLWTISENYYQSGYNWGDIAAENKLTDPNEIEVGQELTIPDVEPRLAESEINEVPLSTSKSEEITLEEESMQSLTEAQTHTVSAGESLWGISEKYYQTGYNWQKIASSNNLSNPNLIEEGQTLTIPSLENEGITTSETEVMQPISGAVYVVEKGDSLWKIALRTYGDGYKWVDIAKENSLANPNLIHVGNSLTLPR